MRYLSRKGGAALSAQPRSDDIALGAVLAYMFFVEFVFTVVIFLCCFLNLAIAGMLCGAPRIVPVMTDHESF